MRIVLKKKLKENECIENIDIGGPSLIRGAAKNFNSVVVITTLDQYSELIEETNNNNNNISHTLRKKFAAQAFKHTAYYDAIISGWFNKNEAIYQSKNHITIKKIDNLRYGENPHQKAGVFSLGNNEIQKISGKDLSFNNINDLEIAHELANQFDKGACVIVKHGNPCGVALNNRQNKAYKKALECDPVSAFGGIVAFNKILDERTATDILRIFTEVIVAPDFSPKSIKLLSKKKNLILVRYKNKIQLINYLLNQLITFYSLKINLKKVEKELKFFNKKPPEKIINDLIFAFLLFQNLLILML